MNAIYVHICSEDPDDGPSSDRLIAGRVCKAPLEKPLLINGTPAVKPVKPIRKRRAKKISSATIEPQQQKKSKKGLF